MNAWRTFIQDADTQSIQLELKVARGICHLGLPLVLGALFLTLASEKSGAALQFNPNGFSIGGYIPFSDANGHWICPIQQAITGHWMSWCDRRPLATALRTVVEFTGRYDHELTQLVQASCIAFGVYLAAITIAIWAGGWSALTFIAFALIDIRSFLSSMLTAPLGFFVGTRAVAAFVLSLSRKSIVLNTAGVCLLTFALLVRMGSMFSIPAVVLWSFWHFRRCRRCALMAGGAALVAVLMVVAASHTTAKFYGEANQLGSNFAFSLAGLSLGGQWDLAERTYRQEISGHSEEEVASILYKKAIQNITNKPSVFLNRLIEGEVYFWQRFFKTMLYGHLLKVSAHPGLAWIMAPIVLIILLAGTGLTIWFRFPDRDEILFISLFFASIAASAPFIMFDDGWRALMATTPFCAMILAFALRSPQPDVFQKALSSFSRPVRITLFAVIPALLIAVTGGPLLFYRLQSQYRQILKDVPTSGPNARTINTNFGRTGFVVVADGAPMPSGAPAISESDFKAVLKSSGIDDTYHRVLGQHVLPHPPYAVFSTTNIDLNSYGMTQLILFGPPWLVEDKKRGFYRITYTPVPNGLKHGATVFNQITRAIPLKSDIPVSQIGDPTKTR